MDQEPVIPDLSGWSISRLQFLKTEYSFALKAAQKESDRRLYRRWLDALERALADKL